MSKFKICWIAFFLLVLVLPLFRINSDRTSAQENRTLAKFPNIWQADRLNVNYGKEFESWLGDRFWGRGWLIHSRFKMLYHINQVNHRVENELAFVGDEGWMFEKKKTTERPSIDQQMAKIRREADILKAFADRFKGKNIPIYLVIIPDRDVLYQRYWDQHYQPKPFINYGEEMARLLKDDPIIIINPQSEMEQVRFKEDVYYRDSDHLSCSGGFQIFLRKIYDVLKQTELPMPDQEPVPIQKEDQNVHVANIAALLGFPSQVVHLEKSCGLAFPKPAYRETKSKSYVETRQTDWVPEQIIYRGGEAVRPYINKVFISIGPCYSEGVFDLFKSVYAQSLWIRTNVDLYGQEAEKHNIQKIKELFDLEPGSAVIVLTQDDDFALIGEALKN